LGGRSVGKKEGRRGEEGWWDLLAFNSLAVSVDFRGGWEVIKKKRKGGGEPKSPL